MPAYSEHYWVGHLSQTIAIAATSKEPQPVLRSALRDFLRDKPPGNPLGDLIRTTLKQKGK